MATFIVPAPAGTSNIAQSQQAAFGQLGQGIGQGVGALLERRRKEKELQENMARIAAFQQQQQFAQQTQLQPGLQGPQIPPPNIAQAGLTGQAGNMALQIALQRQQQQPFTLGPGDVRFGAQGQQIAQVPGAPKATGATHNIVDPDDPTKSVKVRDTFNSQGKLVNRQFLGEPVLAETIGGVAAEGLQRGTQTQIEKDIIGLQETLTELGAIKEQFDPEFFTFRGKGKAFFTDLARQLEIPVSQAQKDFLTKKTKFFADSKRVFLKFRKFITGVAGGIEEFREIAKATIDPEKGSDIAFLAKFDSMRDNAIRTQNVLLAMRNSGLDPKNIAQRRQVFRGRSLKTVPLQVSGNVTLDTLGTQSRQPTLNRSLTRDQRIAELEAKARQ